MTLQERKDRIRRAIDNFQHKETCPKNDYTFMSNPAQKLCGIGCLECRRIIELPKDASEYEWKEAFYEVDCDSRGGGSILDELK